MPDLVVDSDVLIEDLRGNRAIDAKLRDLREKGWMLFYTPVAKAELYHGLRPGEEDATARLFASLRSLPITDEVGEQAGRYLAAYHRSHALEIPDALVAASARIHRASLFTLNRKHFPMKDIRLIS